MFAALRLGALDTLPVVVAAFEFDFMGGSTAAALSKLSQARPPFSSMLSDPAMVAFIGDIVIAEPGALIGFAGPRVIEQTLRQTLPERFQRAAARRRSISL